MYRWRSGVTSELPVVSRQSAVSSEATGDWKIPRSARDESFS
jgi:hypothetical protein